MVLHIGFWLRCIVSLRLFSLSVWNFSLLESIHVFGIDLVGQKGITFPVALRREAGSGVLLRSGVARR